MSNYKVGYRFLAHSKEWGGDSYYGEIIGITNKMYDVRLVKNTDENWETVLSYDKRWMDKYTRPLTPLEALL